MTFRAIASLLFAALAALLSSAPAARDASPVISDADLRAKVADACKGPAHIGEDAFLRADMDGDGREDVLFDWGRVACATPVGVNGGAGFCGMHNCSIDVYLSTQYRPGGWPKPVLHHREITPQIVPGGSFPILRTAISGGSCKFAHVCQFVWRWDGSKLASLAVPQGGAQPLGQRVPPTPADARAAASSAAPSRSVSIAQANVAGNWVMDSDGCATDAGVQLDADGRYSSYEERGSWRLVGNRIAIMVRETYVMGEAGSTRQVRNPEAVVWTILSLGEAQMQVRTPFAESLSLRRCPDL